MISPHYNRTAILAVILKAADLSHQTAWLHHQNLTDLTQRIQDLYTKSVEDLHRQGWGNIGTAGGYFLTGAIATATGLSASVIQPITHELGSTFQNYQTANKTQHDGARSIHELSYQDLKGFFEQGQNTLSRYHQIAEQLLKNMQRVY